MLISSGSKQASWKFWKARTLGLVWGSILNARAWLRVKKWLGPPLDQM